MVLFSSPVASFEATEKEPDCVIKSTFSNFNNVMFVQHLLIYLCTIMQIYNNFTLFAVCAYNKQCIDLVISRFPQMFSKLAVCA